jgi:two-component system phosphate regulon sensor histidine kinase PhoR
MRNDAFQFFPILILAVAVTLLGFLWYQSSSLEKMYLKRIQDELLIRTRLLKPEIKKLLSENETKELNDYSNQIGPKVDTRITVITSNGKVIADSRERPEVMGNHLRRPEIYQAFKGSPGISIRYSSTLSTRMIYAAVPVNINNKRYVLRTAVSIKSIDDVIQQARRDIIIFGLLIALISGVLSYSIVRGVSRPIEDLKFNAARIAAGNLDIKLPIPEKGAIRDLALSLSNMAEQLKNRIDEISREKKERDAIFASMTEGVIALDMEGKIIDLNRAAANMLDLPTDAVGIDLFGAIRNEDLQAFVKQIIKEKKQLEIELTLFGIQERHIQVRGTALKSNGNIFGAVVVLSDFTRIRKLENFRRDFIADVSHEIKTPLTVIRGAVETLQEGAINEPESAEKFMDIITRHSDRLNALVHDILSLSSLERKTQNEERDFTPIKIANPVNTAVDLCREKAERKNVKLEFESDCNAKIEGDCQLLEQAVINLIDNALKYSGEKSDVKVSVRDAGDFAEVIVSDNGCGITSEHLPRLFERFYRVDKARSRKLGGTGLGLAIVKHITQLHKGTVNVESKPGKGSSFTIRLPKYKG